MMRVTTAGFVVLALVGLGACQTGPKPLSNADQAAARHLDSAFAAAANAGDVDALMANFAANAVEMPGNMPMAHGTEQIRGLWTNLLNQGKGTMALTQETADGAGDFMYVTGTYQWVPQPAGSAPAVDGKYLTVFHKGVDGTWKIAADAWSPNAAPPAAEPAGSRAR
jgi:ketosteroid isomerase-like protein